MALRNNRFKTVLGLVLGAALTGAAFTPARAAAEDTVSQATKDKLVASIEAKYKGVTTLKASFTQTTKSELFGDETVKGDLLMKQPSKVRWSFGNDKLFITDGTKMWIYTAEDKQVIEYDDISANKSSAENLLSSLDKLEQTFQVVVLSSSDAGHDIELTPKGDDQFKKVRLMLKGDLMVRKVVITDTFDNVTEIGFTNVELNAKVEDGVFTFQVPTGVDVIKAN